MHQHWSDLSALIQHSEQPPIQFDKAVLQQLHSPSKCFKTGFCVCREAPRRNVHATWFVEALVRFMKPQFWSRVTGKERKKSSARELLEDGKVFLMICPAGAAAGATCLWLHLGFVNYKTWSMSTMQLECKHVDDDGRAHLCMVELQASEMPYLLEQIDEEENADSLHELGLRVRTMLEVIQSAAPLEESLDISFYKFAEDSAPSVPVLEQVLPCFLQVVPMPEVPRHSLWSGSESEETRRRPRGSRRNSLAFFVLGQGYKMI